MAGVAVLLLAAGLGGCNLPNNAMLPTPLPAEALPTVIAATMAAHEASLLGSQVPAPLPEETGQVTPQPSATLEPSPTPQPILAQPTDSQTPATLVSEATPTTPTLTPFPELPIAGIQVFKPGDLSKVVSPIDVSAYLRPGAGGRVTIELFGEDGRLLVRQIRVYDVTPGARVNLAEKVPYQISAAAEVGRLVISMADEANRTIALNSIDLILLSLGEADINPSDALQEFIYIKQPALKRLVQGGSVLVSGLARTFTDQPLVVHLIAEDGRVVGQRVVGVGERLTNGYGEYAVEVAYNVRALTPVRVTIYEIGLPVSPIRYLASLEVVLGP